MRLFTLIIWLIALSSPFGVYAQVNFPQKTLGEAIEIIEENTPYRFLYRDALIAKVRVSFDETAITDPAGLSTELNRFDIDIHVDYARHQVFLFKKREKEVIKTLSGRVVDAETGAALPFAALSWQREGQIDGISSSWDGDFLLLADRLFGSNDSAVIKVSYVGYKPVEVRLEASNIPSELIVRLNPTVLYGSDVLILGSSFNSVSDSLWQSMSKSTGSFMLGGENPIRSLSVLPAVSQAGVYSGGVNVRGSKPDEFEVLLDGLPVYNHQHFFGLFDAFNPDVLRSVGFYYTVTPAYFSGPPGATLSYMTRTGSQQNIRANAGVSNAAVRKTIEGPLNGGKGSWLISGRYALLGVFGSMGNQALVQWGLDANRPNSGSIEPEMQVVNPIKSESDFFDIHGGGYYEFGDGYRLNINGYFGGNEARQFSNRTFRIIEPGEIPRFEVREVITDHRWGNQMVSAKLQHPFMERSFLSTEAGFSRYYSRYDNDDFQYTRNTGSANLIQQVTGQFSNENELVDLRVNQSLDMLLSGAGFITAGHTVRQFMVRYNEDNIFDPAFEQTRYAWQWDMYGQLESNLGERLSLNSGMRIHYFSDGGYFRFSPRIELKYSPLRWFDLLAGYSRNYQFLHSLSLSNYVMADFWIISSKDSGPSSADNFTAGLYFRPNKNNLIQIESYYKSYQNLRLPKVNARAFITSSDFENTPWFSQNDGRSVGIEVLHRVEMTPGWTLTSAYSWSTIEFRNDRLNQGEWFHPEWDRTHEVNFRTDYVMASGFSAYLNWIYATGNFNELSLINADEPDRLGDYHRLDGGLTLRFERSSYSIDIQVGVYNVYNRQNPLYRTTLFAVDTERQRPGFVSEIADIYDLGIMPSVGLTVRF